MRGCRTLSEFIFTPQVDNGPEGDQDLDGIINREDNCITLANADQANHDQTILETYVTR